MRASLALSLPLILSGCISLTVGETGRALGSGGSRLGAAVTSGVFSEVSIDGERDSFSDVPENDFDFYPVLEASAAYGVGPRTDVGVRANTATFVAARAKHQAAGTTTTPFAVSVGGEAGGNVGVFLFGYGYVYGAVSATASYHPRPGVALVASARYVTVAVEPFAPEGVPGSRLDGTAWGFPGVSYGVAVGGRDQITVEVSHTQFGSPSPSQVALGYHRRLR